MLKAAGYDSFPTDWDAMVEMSKKLSGDGVYGFAWPLGNQANAATRLVQQLYTYGGDILNEDGTKCTLDSEAAKKALGNIVTSISEGYASPGSAEIDNTKMRVTEQPHVIAQSRKTASCGLVGKAHGKNINQRIYNQQRSHDNSRKYKRNRSFFISGQNLFLHAFIPFLSCTSGAVIFADRSWMESGMPGASRRTALLICYAHCRNKAASGPPFQ